MTVVNFVGCRLEARFHTQARGPEGRIVGGDATTGDKESIVCVNLDVRTMVSPIL